MTEEELQTIISAVISSLQTNGKTVQQLTASTSIANDDYFELDEGRKVSFEVVANAVKTTLELITESDLTTLSAQIENYFAHLNDEGYVNFDQSPIVLLDSMGATLDNVDGGYYDYIADEGDLYYYSHGNYQIWLAETYGASGTTGAEGYAAREGVLYINKHTGRMYVWDGSAMQEIVGEDYGSRAVIYYMNEQAQNMEVGKLGYQFTSSGGKLVVRTGTNTTWVADPDPNRIYCDATTDTTVRWDASGQQWVSIGGGSSSGSGDGTILNIRDGVNYRVWIGTQEQLEALSGAYEDDVIYIVGAVASSAPISVSNISISSSQNGNVVSLTATLTPSNTTQRGVSWSLSSSTYASLTSNGLSATLTILEGANNTSVTVTCRSTSNSGIYGTKTLTLTYDNSTIESIDSISYVSAGTNLLQFSAETTPSGATTPAIVWSVSNTSVATINSSTGLLTILASGTVSVTATSGSNSRTLRNIAVTKTGESGTITEITAITATRTAANTLTLEAEADGDTPTISFSLASVPTVKKVDRSGSTPTVTTVDAVELSGDQLTYKGDCSVTVVATAGSISFSQVINIVHTSADVIYFEDEAVESVLIENSIGSSSGITYAQAAAVTSVRMFNGDTDIMRFKEFMYFGCTSLGSAASSGANFIGCTSLECIGLPSTLTKSEATSAAYNPFYDCVLSEVHVESIAAYCGITFANYSSMTYAGQVASGFGLYVDGVEVTNIVIPSSVTSISNYAFSGFTHITRVEIQGAATLGGAYVFRGCTSLATIKIGDSMTGLTAQAFRDLTALTTVDIGSGISALSSQTFRACTALTSLTMRYAGVVTSNNSFYNGASISDLDLYVPSGQVSAYQADSTWSAANSINAIS